MNNKELIEKYEETDKFAEMVKVRYVIENLKQLDEPQKPVVPQFVADYIDFKKENDFHVYGAMRVIEDHYDKRVQEWFYEGNIETFARAWLDGYTVEEKRYLVKMKGMVEGFMVLKLDKFRDGWYLGNDTEYSYTKAKHTRKELEEAGFGWVFDCPGVEIEEVEE